MLDNAIHVGSQDRRQIKNIDNTQNKYNTKHNKTKLAWFSRLLWHSARKWDGLILQCSRAHARWFLAQPAVIFYICPTLIVDYHQGSMKLYNMPWHLLITYEAEQIQTQPNYLCTTKKLVTCSASIIQQLMYYIEWMCFTYTVSIFLRQRTAEARLYRLDQGRRCQMLRGWKDGPNRNLDMTHRD